jgi:hypothetical protein
VFPHFDMTSIMIRVGNLVLKTLYIQLFSFKCPFDKKKIKTQTKIGDDLIGGA